MGLRREACVSGGTANGAESGAAFSVSYRVLERPMAVGGLFYSADAALPLLHRACRTINAVTAQNKPARKVDFMRCVPR